MKLLQDHLQELADQTVIVRTNFDVPIKNYQVEDTTRIESTVNTLLKLRQVNARLVLLSHYDRPEGFQPEKSLRPVVPVLESLLKEQIEFIDFQPDINTLTLPHTHPISLIENLRFWPQEEANEPDFGHTLSNFGQFYVNEAFANCHREHASIVTVPKHLPSFAGYSLAQEIEVLSKVKSHPDKPLVVVIGGAKLETKEPLIEVFANTADHILVGGKSALDLHAKNQPLPPNVQLAELTPDGRDITKASAQAFAQIIMSAATVIWNGTMGVFEEPQHRLGTTLVAQAVNQTPAYTLVGGGDTETALTILELEKGIDFISSGGGAMLTYLTHGQLVGLEVLSS